MDAAALDRRRVVLGDGLATTVYIVEHRLGDVWPTLVRLDPPAPLECWCAERGIAEAVSGGFSVKPEHEPLGEVCIGGSVSPHRPFRAPWHRRRAALLCSDGTVRIGLRDRLAPRPRGDLLQAGPLLVADGHVAIAGVPDPEGFSTTADEFDEDITAAREPRLALAVRGDVVLVVAADGRTRTDAGLTLWELADVLVELGATEALNLDAGSAGVLVSGGRRINTPRDDEGKDMEPSAPTVTAVLFSAAPSRR